MPTLEQCPDAAGSFNNPTTENPAGLPAVSAYVLPDLCVGDYSLTSPENASDSAYQEQVAAENLMVSGAAVNVFKLLGIHEQGKLIDLTGAGMPLGGIGAVNAFDELAGSWVSQQTGADVRNSAFIGYDFGIRKTSYDAPEVLPEANMLEHITSFRITQGDVPSTRVLQVRVDRSNGGYFVDPAKIEFSGVGNGGISNFTPGVSVMPGLLMLTALSPTTFSVLFTAETTSVLGVAIVGQRFNSNVCSFTILNGTIPFATNDFMTAPIDLQWLRVDVVNLPNTNIPALIRIAQSAPSRYWRLVPLLFAGETTNDPWVIQKLEFMDYAATRLDDIQDQLFMENRDRDYAKTAIQVKAAYTPFDAVTDLGKFGFNMADVYTFTTSYAMMVKWLGRPIVVGDILELPSEVQYDHNLKPVRKFLEVSDVSWATDGFTTTWRPILYRFQASQLIPGQEHRDLLGTVDTQKYIIDDGSFFEGVQQIQTAGLTSTEATTQESLEAVPRKGTNTAEVASGTNRFNQPGSYDGVGPFVEDGLPPDGMQCEVGFKLPDVGGASDGDYFRLEYDPKLKISARLYKFNGVKNKWIHIETDRRGERSSHKPSQLSILNMSTRTSLTDKSVK